MKPVRVVLLFDSIIRLTARSDDVLDAVQHGVSLLEQHWRDRTDTRFQQFTDVISTGFTTAEGYQDEQHTLCQQDCLQVLTVLINVEHRYAPERSSHDDSQ